MAKRLRVEDDFNPVYPYGYARNQNIPFLTPPFVSSDGFKNFPPGVLSLKLADPITITNGDVSLKVGGGLTVEKESGNLTVNPKAPLQVAKGQLELAYDSPFDVKNNMLTLKAGHGLAVVTKDNTDLQPLMGTLVVLTGKGIGTGTSAHGGTIDVRIGKNGSLAFDKDGDLVAWDKENDRRTLWTTPDTSPNCKMSEAKDSKLTLILTKCGSQILGSVSLLAVKGEYQNMTANTKKNVKITLLFDANGVLLAGSSLDKEYWNFRSNDSTVSGNYENAVQFMPNITAYKPTNSKSYARSVIFGNVYIDAKPYNPVVIKISFNQETQNNCVYSISFDYTLSKDYPNMQFDVTSFTFSYIAQE
ncbi:fiber [Human adenovirus 43]|uniref:Fiber n=7 Tax=Human mastadenovirus D TaxID=130310 RepID=M0QVJ5_9ADEN|nr:fiber [Human adenovirus 43]AGF39174.1 fiber protein (pIV) [Human adenovirus 43]AHV83683.1 fiber [Human mastadenovirus D]